MSLVIIIIIIIIIIKTFYFISRLSRNTTYESPGSLTKNGQNEEISESLSVTFHYICPEFANWRLFLIIVMLLQYINLYKLFPDPFYYNCHHPDFLNQSCVLMVLYKNTNIV